MISQEDKTKADLADSGIKTGYSVWENAKATWNAGKKELSVTKDGKSASTKDNEAQEFIATLKPESQDRLLKKKKPLAVQATVEEIGNQKKLISLIEMPS